MSDKRVQERRGNSSTLIQKLRALLRKIGVLVEHPSEKAKEEYRDNKDERDRRNRRKGTVDAKDDRRGTLRRRS